jgi:hypothetical protein
MNAKARAKADAIAEARLRKAHRLLDVIVKAGGTADDLHLPNFPWHEATVAAGVNPPSDETKALVRNLARAVEAQAARISTTTTESEGEPQ